MTTGHRTALVATAAAQWVNDLIDLGGRNTLLYYKDLRVGTLDLETAEQQAMTTLLGGRSVRLSALYPDPVALADARKRVRAIHKKVRELREERGIGAGYVALGMATWTEESAGGSTRTPAAPVVLRALTLAPRSAAEDDFELTLSDVSEVNPVLLHKLAQEFGTQINGDDLADLLALQTGYDPEPVFDRLAKLTNVVPGFAVRPRSVLGTFTYAKLPMVNDLENGAELLAAHDVIAALAGDGGAQQTIRGTDTVSISAPNHAPPQDEFLVEDADSSQNYAINAVVAGKNLVIKGPPGTGKSQTITNLVATLVARGQRVLFVAEKRAAIDAVLSRLAKSDLTEWVMDLHDGAANRRKVAQSLAATLDRARRTPAPQLDRIHRDLTTHRSQLLAHDAALHRVREPWGVSAFDAQTRLLGLGTPAVSFRIRGVVLDKITEWQAASLGQDIVEFAELGGVDSASQQSPWFGAPIQTPEQARAALDTVGHLAQRTVPDVSRTLHNVLAETGLRAPATVAEWQLVLSLLDAAAHALSEWRPEVFDAPLPDLVAATATRSWRKQHGVGLRWSQRRQLRKQAKTLALGAKPSLPDLHQRLVAAQQLRDSWAGVCVDGGPPRLPGNLPGAHGAYEQLSMELRALGAFMHASTQLEAVHTAALPDQLARLAADQQTLARLPRRNELESRLVAAGLGDLLAECTTRGIGPNQIGMIFESVWLTSILDAIALTDSTYGAFRGQTMDRVVADFQARDVEHIKTTASRVQRSCAEHLISALDAHPEQATLIRAEANKQRRHRPMRDLLRAAPDVLLALKPCWAMSPLVVSQLLPLQQLFDVVIFDEASQIPPADAIPAILRGKRLTVAGDERQLPPTGFFASAGVDGETEDGFLEGADGEIAVSVTDGYESILDSLAAILPFRSLTWHYRSQDERLIAFSNTHIYQSSLTTFPGARANGVLSHVAVPHIPGRVGQEESASAEVQAVVDLVLDHARTRPTESLGVITMGIKHADRIETEVRQAVANNPELNGFFSEDQANRFFVKNLERVQGDERDAIILSIGYGKNADGRMLYRFGPLNNKGGERRLNVAVTRAKKRMTLVSSFTHHDLDPNRLNADGARLLGQYLAFMHSGGSDLGSVAAVPPPMNPFETDVRDRLTRAGIPLIAQHGVSGYRIDFAASHPDKPGRMVLAIEADGASYHSSATARDRDRLRQQHLERLGWTFHRIWSTEWFRDPATEVLKAKEAYARAVAAANASDNATTTRPIVPSAQRLRLDRPASAAAVAAPPAEQPRSTGNGSPQRSLTRPRLPWGLPITEYSSGQLISLVRWIESDGLLRTTEDLRREVMAELGYRRRGKRIDEAILAAIARARS